MAKNDVAEAQQRPGKDDMEAKWLAQYQDMEADRLVDELMTMRREKAGVDRANSALSDKVSKLEATQGQETELAKKQSESLQEYATRLESKAELLNIREKAIERAIAHDIDPALAVQLSHNTWEEAESGFNLLVDEIRRKTEQGVDERLGSSGFIPQSGDKSPLSDEERARTMIGLSSKEFKRRQGIKV